jgi:hypothetical protein
VRLTVLGAVAALSCGLALSACSSGAGSSSTVPLTGGGQAVSQGRSHGHSYTVRIMPGVKRLVSGCDYSTYAFCIEIVAGNAGPYVETSTAPSYQLENDGWIVKNSSKKGKIDKKFDDYFYPDPGNPTYQYIDYKGKAPKKGGTVKYTDYYCIGFAPSTDCNGNYGTYTFKIGVAIEPAT